MKKLLLTLVCLSLTARAHAQTNLPIFNHPQASVYADPTAWPSISSQCHWPRLPGLADPLDMSHVHWDLTWPIYTIFTGPMTLPVTLGSFNNTESIIRDDDTHPIFAETLYHDGGILGTISLPDGPLVSQDGVYTTWNGTITVTPPIPHGWFWVAASAYVRLEDGSIMNVIGARPMWSMIDPTAPITSYGGWPYTECQFFSAAHNDGQAPQLQYGQQEVAFDFLQFDDPTQPFIPVPIASMTNAWPMYMSSFGYGQGQLVPQTTTFVLDPDFHHHNPGMTMESVTRVSTGPGDPADLNHFPIVFNQTGTHKYATIRSVIVPGVGGPDANGTPTDEHIMVLLVLTATGNADMSPTPQPFPNPIVDNPPPPAPVSTKVQVPVFGFEDFIDNVPQGTFTICVGDNTHCKPF